MELSVLASVGSRVICWPWQQSAYFQAQGMIDGPGAGGSRGGALLPKCLSHDSLTSGPPPFLLSLSPSLNSALLWLSLSSLRTKPSEPWSFPGSLPLLAEARFQLLDTALGPWALEVRANALALVGGTWRWASYHFLLPKGLCALSAGCQARSPGPSHIPLSRTDPRSIFMSLPISLKLCSVKSVG